jgi:hypothetical protein
MEEDVEDGGVMVEDDVMAGGGTAAAVTSGAPEGSCFKAFSGSCLAAFAARGCCDWGGAAAVSCDCAVGDGRESLDGEGVSACDAAAAAAAAAVAGFRFFVLGCVDDGADDAGALGAV